MKPHSGDVVVIGVGNTDRGDDGVGRYVIGRLRERPPPSVELIDHHGETAGLLELMTGTDCIYIVDAASTGDEPGTIFRFDAADGPLPAAVSGWSTHGFGVAEAIELARAFGELPSHCVIYAIEGGSYETGAPVSAAVVRGADELVKRILDELERTALVASDDSSPRVVR